MFSGPDAKMPPYIKVLFLPFQFWGLAALLSYSTHRQQKVPLNIHCISARLFLAKDMAIPHCNFGSKFPGLFYLRVSSPGQVFRFLSFWVCTKVYSPVYCFLSASSNLTPCSQHNIGIRINPEPSATFHCFR